MKGWTLQSTGEPEEVMRWTDLPEPTAGSEQVTVDVTACALSYPDLLLVRGAHQQATVLPSTPGVELVGRVRQVGPGVTGLAKGDRVVGLAAMPHGGLAEQAVCDAGSVRPVPAQVADVTAAAMFTALQTAWFALVHRANLRPGEWLLVHAGAGGVGSAAIQLGRALGARVIAATVRCGLRLVRADRLHAHRLPQAHRGCGARLRGRRWLGAAAVLRHHHRR